MQKSITKRLHVTGRGKVMRRKMGQSHFRAKRTSRQRQRRKKNTTVAGVDFRQLSRTLKSL